MSGFFNMITQLFYCTHTHTDRAYTCQTLLNNFVTYQFWQNNFRICIRWSYSVLSVSPQWHLRDPSWAFAHLHSGAALTLKGIQGENINYWHFRANEPNKTHIRVYTVTFACLARQIHSYQQYSKIFHKQDYINAAITHPVVYKAYHTKHNFEAT